MYVSLYLSPLKNELFCRGCGWIHQWENFSVGILYFRFSFISYSLSLLNSLEKKLRRIKGLNQEVTSKDMLRTLAQAKKECWDRFLQEKLASEFFVDGLDSDER